MARDLVTPPLGLYVTPGDCHTVPRVAILLAAVCHALSVPFCGFRIAPLVHSDGLDLVLIPFFEADEFVASPRARLNQFVDLCLERRAIAILRRLQDRQEEQRKDADRQVCAGNKVFVARDVRGNADAGQAKTEH